MKISRIACFEVIVPAKKGSVESKSINKPLHKLESGVQKAWTMQFDQVSKLIVKLELDGGIVGWGELYRGHSWQNVSDIAAILIDMDINSITLQKLPFSYCREYDGFECAIWDAYAKVHHMQVVDLLGGAVQDKVRVGAWSSHRNMEDIAELVGNFTNQGYDCIKFKCDLEDEVVQWSAAVHAANPQMKIILDPNERWLNVYEVKKRLKPLSEIGNVLCIEDPISRWKLNDFHLLRNFSSVPIALHVALPYIQHGQRIKDAIQAIQNNAVDGFNFNGCLSDFQRLSNIAAAAEIPCWHGSEIDLGILEARYVHSAIASTACTWPSDIFGRLIREHDLLKQPIRIDPPYAYLPDGPGLGVEVDEEAVRHYMIRHKEFKLA
ncbi:mandelate racemase/muconate lactonizing enzyme family protein [Membranicola marinus]|uniref:Mandelate racemase/muconate lactonizing enzyme family protein n=1 Tax=Membranihabitans marinus TaxID=1227546 RepID=A0A953HMS8_9BACT|nr:mandelate racemase/muconate lactonizing enzyme family protein [Membranihabitans marinus]MBY5958507.1 mandelate racemase/muconate lactonizing enzyme family protein [Membranihabitans marinus]